MDCDELFSKEMDHEQTYITRAQEHTGLDYNTFFNRLSVMTNQEEIRQKGKLTPHMSMPSESDLFPYK